MLDLEKEYKNIICKTALSGKTSKMEEMLISKIQTMISKIPDNMSIVIRGGGIHTKRILSAIWEKYTREEFAPIAIIDNKQAGNMIEGIRVIDDKEAANMQYDVVIISSYKYADEMSRDYDADKYIILNIYQELKKDGIYLECPFYYHKKDSYEIALYYINKYRKEETKDNLEYVIDAVLEIKDFRTALKYIDKYIDLGYDDKGIYKDIRCDFEELFVKVKQLISNRGGKDIIMFWIDAVPYNRLSWLPYVYSKKEKSCFFEYPYTVTPYTHPTMNTLLQGALKIDDYDVTRVEIDRTNSEVIQDLEKAGYQFYYFGYQCKGYVSKKYIMQTWQVDYYDRASVSCCSIYWAMMCRLINEVKPVFYIAHSVSETHEPYIALNLDDNRTYQPEIAFETEQSRKTYMYADEQVEFYSGLLDERMTKIYMSDHGTTFYNWHFIEQRIRTFFMVEGEKIITQKISPIFSYQHFKYIVKWLLFNDMKYLKSALSDYALIQDVDTYNPRLINIYTNAGKPEIGMSFRGIVTKDDKYVKIGNGKEFYFRLDGEQEREEEITNYQERVEILKKMSGNTFLDLNKHSEFESSKKLYE